MMLLAAVRPAIAAAQQPPSSAPDAATPPSKADCASGGGRAARRHLAGRAGGPRAPPSTPPAAPPTGRAAARRGRRAPRAQAAAPARTAAPGQKSTATDRIDLGVATVTGDREQPKVMYIVPWKKSDIGDLSGKPMNSLLDEALAPVDRDEFKREVVYYTAVKADASQNGASRPPAKQGEK